MAFVVAGESNLTIILVKTDTLLQRSSYGKTSWRVVFRTCGTRPSGLCVPLSISPRGNPGCCCRCRLPGPKDALVSLYSDCLHFLLLLPDGEHCGTHCLDRVPVRSMEITWLRFLDCSDGQSITDNLNSHRLSYPLYMTLYASASGIASGISTSCGIWTSVQYSATTREINLAVYLTLSLSPLAPRTNEDI